MAASVEPIVVRAAVQRDRRGGVGTDQRGVFAAEVFGLSPEALREATGDRLRLRIGAHKTEFCVELPQIRSDAIRQSVAHRRAEPLRPRVERRAGVSNGLGPVELHHDRVRHDELRDALALGGDAGAVLEASRLVRGRVVALEKRLKVRRLPQYLDRHAPAVQQRRGQRCEVREDKVEDRHRLVRKLLRKERGRLCALGPLWRQENGQIAAVPPIGRVGEGAGEAKRGDRDHLWGDRHARALRLRLCAVAGVLPPQLARLQALAFV